MTRIIGIDPGMTGAVAWTDDGETYQHRRLYATGSKTRTCDRSGLALELALLCEGRRVAAYIEAPLAIRKTSPHSLLWGGVAWGDMWRALVDAGAMVSEVGAQHWQRAMGLSERLKETDDNKALLCWYARQWSGLGETLPKYAADAVLIALYGWQHWHSTGQRTAVAAGRKGHDGHE